MQAKSLRSLWRDETGVSSMNVAVLVAFAALAMPGFIALGDGLAETVVEKKRARVASFPGSGTSQNTPESIEHRDGDAPPSVNGRGNNFTGNGSGGDPPSDYWGGGETSLFTSARPGTTPWDDHVPTPPDTFVGEVGDFGDWGDPEPVAESTGGLTSEAPAFADRSHTPTPKQVPSEPPSLLSSLASSAEGFLLDLRSGLGALGEGWFGSSRGKDASPPSQLQTGASVPVENQGMTPRDAIEAILANPTAFSHGPASLRTIERHGFSMSLEGLQRLANGDDPELAAVAKYILQDRALREALTGGSGSMTTDDLRALASEMDGNKTAAESWSDGRRIHLDPFEIDLVLKNSEDGNPPGWARNAAYVLGTEFDLLADSTAPDGRPRLSKGTLEAIAKMKDQELEEFLDGRESQFSHDQLRDAARAAVDSGLIDYLDAPPGMGVEANGNVGREMLLSFSDESQRQGESWAGYLRDDNATVASTEELRSEDGANAIDGEPLVLRAKKGDLFAEAEIDPRQRRVVGKVKRPKADDVVQGALGDCWAMSGLAAFAETKPEVIRNAIEDNGDGTYTVTLYNLEGERVETTVDNEFAASAYDQDGQLFAQAESALWASVMEKAMTETLDGRNGHKDDMMSIDGGQDAMIHQMLTGEEAETVYLAQPTKENASEQFLNEMPKGATVASSGADAASMLEDWVKEGRAVTATTINDPQNKAVDSNDLTAGHSYTVTKAAGGKVTVRDPRGGKKTISKEEFSEAFVSMSAT